MGRIRAIISTKDTFIFGCIIAIISDINDIPNAIIIHNNAFFLSPFNVHIPPIPYMIVSNKQKSTIIINPNVPPMIAVENVARLNNAVKPVAKIVIIASVK